MLTKSQIIKKLKGMKEKALTKAYKEYEAMKDHFPAYMKAKLMPLHTEQFIEDYNKAVADMNRMSAVRYDQIRGAVSKEDIKGSGIFRDKVEAVKLKPIEELYGKVYVNDWQFDHTVYGFEAGLKYKGAKEKIETEFNALIGNAMSMKTNEIRALSKSLGLEIEDKPCTALLSPTDMSYLKEVIKKCQETT